MYKIKYLTTFLLLAATHSFSQSALPSNANGNTLLWEISGSGLAKPSYLYGTFHLMCKDDVQFSGSCKQAIANSDKVYLELDMDDPATLLSGMMLMNMKGGKKLKDLYKPEEYERLTRYFTDSLKTSLSMFQGFKPFFLMAMLYPRMMPCDAVSGVEEGIMKLAKANNLEIEGLETMAFQAAVFDSIPYAEQAKELLSTLDSMDKSKKYFSLMTAAYKNQQMQEIEKLMNDGELNMEANQDVLLNNRNKNWVAQLKTIMVDMPVFVAVGAGHLPGKDGLINLLKEAGYQLRPLQNN